MDSITQITLGAAVGEAVAGKKIGNRALFWGAVAGTIPDLDVLGDFFLSGIESLAFHRGFTHSITFSLLGAIFFGWCIHRMYASEFHRYIRAGVWSIVVLGVFFLVNQSIFSGQIYRPRLIITILLLMGAGLLIYNKYLSKIPGRPEMDMRSWTLLFFWALFTHPILDSFTTFGTQLYQPFSDYRAGFNTISVVDPVYTVPFLICVITCGFKTKGSQSRSWINWLGIGLSSTYLLATVIHKQVINQIFEKTLESEQIVSQRYMTNPTILNNLLWYGCAESDSSVFIGLYSVFDREKRFKLEEISKKHDLLDAKPDDRTANVLKWFSNGYFTIIEKPDGKLQFNDMRYGTFDRQEGDKRNYIFNFMLKKNPQGYYDLLESNAGPPDRDGKEMLKELISRIEGI